MFAGSKAGEGRCSRWERHVYNGLTARAALTLLTSKLLVVIVDYPSTHLSVLQTFKESPPFGASTLAFCNPAVRQELGNVVDQ